MELAPGNGVTRVTRLTRTVTPNRLPLSLSQDPPNLKEPSMRLTLKLASALALTGLSVLGCTDSTGLGKPAPISVTLQQASSAAAAPSFQIMSPQGPAGVISLADVDSLNVRVTGVEALPVVNEEDSANDGAWQSVDVVGNGLLNLVKLPTETQGAFVVASDSVPSGDYGHVRFFMQDMTIWLNKQIQVGQIIFQANTPYTVTLPSGAQTGLKTKAQFTIPEGGGQVAIVFDGTATLANLSVTGTGAVVLAPVLQQR